MTTIADMGRQYGLELNWKKTECLPIRCDTILHSSDGLEIQSESSITYLGALVASDGKIDSELSRRLGAAGADFKELSKVWNHGILSR